MNLIQSILGLQPSARPKPTVGQQIRFGGQFARETWQKVLSASHEYRKALDLKEDDLDTMEHLDAYVVVTLPDRREVNIVVKNTCGSPYGGTWTMLLQAHMRNTKPQGIGNGTTFITLLSPENHELVLTAIARGDIRTAKGRIWP